MSVSQWLANTGQYWGLPEMNMSEAAAGGTNTQTRPDSLYTTGLFGSGGYVTSPISSTSYIDPSKEPGVNPPPQNPPYQKPTGYNYNSQGTVVQQDVNAGRSGNSVTASQALAKGWDVNNLPGGYTLAQEGGGESDISAQLDSAYAPAYRNLQDIQAQYEAEYPNSQAFINNSYNEALTPLANQQSTQLAGLDTQEAKGKQEEKSQFSKARQKYNELRQGGLTRFGGASSTGEAYGELLGRATSQEMGGITQNFGQYQMDIEKERGNVNNFFAEKKTNLEKEKQLKLQELKTSFDTEIRKINSQKAALDSEKAGRRLAALQEYSAQARQAQYDAQAFSQKLDAWKAMRDETIQLASQFNAKSFSVPSMPGVMGGFSVTGQNQGGTSGTQTGVYDPEQLNAMGLSPTGYNTKTGSLSYGKSDDEEFSF